MLEYNKMYLDERRKETIEFRNEMLHYGLYIPKYRGYLHGDIPWHWHDEFEFGHILSGSILYKTNHHEYLLKAGDGIFINSGVLHYLHPLEPLEEVCLQTQFVDKLFLAGYLGSVFDIKYITPIQEQKQVDALPFYMEKRADSMILEKLNAAADLSIKGEKFFEMRLRNLFSEIWENVYNFGMDEEKFETRTDVIEDERIKKILLYVQEHYNEKLTVEEIASNIPASERECYRLFHKGLGITPMEFVMSFRLQMAQEMLTNTKKSILEIALETGFGTSSYFGKTFKKQYHTTPKKYRDLYYDKKTESL